MARDCSTRSCGTVRLPGSNWMICCSWDPTVLSSQAWLLTANAHPSGSCSTAISTPSGSACGGTMTFAPNSSARATVAATRRSASARRRTPRSRRLRVPADRRARGSSARPCAACRAATARASRGHCPGRARRRATNTAGCARSAGRVRAANAAEIHAAVRDPRLHAQEPSAPRHVQRSGGNDAGQSPCHPSRRTPNRIAA